MLQLVRKAEARIVTFTFERHAEDSHALSLETKAAFCSRNEIER
jgi:hypothetical protein